MHLKVKKKDQKQKLHFSQSLCKEKSDKHRSKIITATTVISKAFLLFFSPRKKNFFYCKQKKKLKKFSVIIRDVTKKK